MTGKARSGLDAADPDLFRGISWALVARPGTPASAIDALSELVRALGAEPLVVDAETHDRGVAIVSHLPQLLALVLCEQAASTDGALELAGPVFRDLARLASSSFPLWRDIFSSNQDMVRAAVREVQRRLGEAAADVDSDRLAAHFEAASSAVSGYPHLESPE